jgi:hypothetical protein
MLVWSYVVVSHDKHCENGRHRRSPMIDDMMILRAKWNNFTVAVDLPSRQYGQD